MIPLADILTLTTSQLCQISSGERFKILGVIQQIKRRSDKNNKPFWEISLVDSEGSMDAKVWSDGKWWDSRYGERVPLDPLMSGMPAMMLHSPVGVIGTASEFKGKMQYQFLEIFLLDPERFPISGFIQASPVLFEKMEEELRSMISSCGPVVRDFLDKVFSGDLLKDFLVLPAAVSHHHAYVHGLLEHTLAVTRGARALGGTYRDSGVELDLDIVTAGGLLHDIGKVESYRLAPFPSMTVPGTVIDHIALGYSSFSALAKEYDLDSDLATAIGHIIISHHGRKEYGSPVLPATPEAMVVASSDELDFMMYCWGSFPESGNGEASISDFHPSAQRRFWRAKTGKEGGS